MRAFHCWQRVADAGSTTIVGLQLGERGMRAPAEAIRCGSSRETPRQAPSHRKHVGARQTDCRSGDRRIGSCPRISDDGESRKHFGRPAQDRDNVPRELPVRRPVPQQKGLPSLNAPFIFFRGCGREIAACDGNPVDRIAGIPPSHVHVFEWDFSIFRPPPKHLATEDCDHRTGGWISVQDLAIATPGADTVESSHVRLATWKPACFTARTRTAAFREAPYSIDAAGGIERVDRSSRNERHDREVARDFGLSAECELVN